MNALLETLVTISKLEAVASLEKKQVALDELTEIIVTDIQKNYQDKNIILTPHLQKNISKKIHKESRMIIVKNILENAYKFTPAGGSIDIKLDAKKLVIKDSGK
ncbi:MAG: hypothetical protein WCH65_09035 [bacterium]